MARIAQIVSTARCLPEHIVTNAELTARFAALGRPDVINKLAGRTGINQRSYAPKELVTSDPPCWGKRRSSAQGVNLKMSTWSFSARRPRTTLRRTRRLFCNINSAQRTPAHLTSIVPARPFRRRSPSPPD